MAPQKNARASAPTPFMAGYKRYFLLEAAVLVAFLGYYAFVEPFLFGVEFQKPKIVFAGLAAFLFMGLLVWASNENDKDKVWGELLSKYLEDPTRSQRDDIQLADFLPENSQELTATLNVPLASDLKSPDAPGYQLNRRLFSIASLMAYFGALVAANQLLRLPIVWSMGEIRASDVDLAIIFIAMGAVLLIPYGLIKLLSRRPLLLSTGYSRLDKDSAKHRRYNFCKFHRQILLDNGFEELFDARFDSTRCTFFVSSNRDMVAEVGVNRYGRMYYGVRTVTEDGTLYQSRSGGFIPGSPSVSESVQLYVSEKMPIEDLLRKHAVLLAKRLLESKSRLVILKDKVIDQLFLANRFRHPA